MKHQPIFRRILLKLSGEALMGNSDFGIDPSVIARMAKEVAELIRLNVQVGLVIGGGNLFRGRALSEAGLGRITGDYMGMLATVMNALAFRDVLEQFDVPTRVMSAIPMSGVVDHYDRRKASYHLDEGRVVIFSAGTGNPLVTTDSAASLRSIEVDADILLKATTVDGIYDSDPAKNPHAKRYQRLTYSEVLSKELGVMDLSAFCQCRDHNMPIRVFNVTKAGALLRIITGEDEGTLVTKGD
ncbi:MAG: UMP kinase [Legionellales bacterium]|nr:UMP kinase [Legionellales bacterium]